MFIMKDLPRKVPCSLCFFLVSTWGRHFPPQIYTGSQLARWSPLQTERSTQSSQSHYCFFLKTFQVQLKNKGNYDDDDLWVIGISRAIILPRMHWKLISLIWIHRCPHNSLDLGLLNGEIILMLGNSANHIYQFLLILSELFIIIIYQSPPHWAL